MTFFSFSELAAAAVSHEVNLMETLRQLVEIESPSDDKAAVDRCVDLAAKIAEKLGGKIRRHRQKAFGDILEARFFTAGARGRKPILLLGHLDTVWPIGTLEKMPFRVAEGRVWGPGTLDMKAGAAMAFAAIALVRDLPAQLRRPVTLLLVSDEEVGSTASRAITEKIAKECEAVYVLEPAQGLAPGAYKTARKGIGHYRIHVRGVAAHSGVDFGNGHSAIHELAYQTGIIAGFTELQRGITVNVGTFAGGSRSNVVAAEAVAEVDVRIAKRSDVARVERKFRRLRARDRGCVLTVEGGLNRPPMERTRGTVALYRQARTLAGKLGFSLQEAATGGGSDGNFTSALGIPTLDGMGAVGEGAHAPHESLLVKDLAPRTALLAAMLLELHDKAR
ncbi:M20 family metallopeptidase [Silvibacterium sp.]|uniref:M20 family metallopeptidase n=1 Tax=Silvibacterium sp. TaxID=1964179 RepID=UPI0039E2B8CD